MSHLFSESPAVLAGLFGMTTLKTWTVGFVILTFGIYLGIAWLSRVSDTKGFFIAGGGGIGRALGLLLRNEPSVDAQVIIGDLSLEAANEAAEFASAGGTAPAATGIAMPRDGSDAALDDALAGSAAII
ncbi:MAG: hypothetical protein AAGL98_02740, partial [Planctomycetota bacterium]